MLDRNQAKGGTLHVGTGHFGLGIAVLAVMFGSAPVQAGNVWFVEPAGRAANGCTSWEDACSDLQIALDLAQPGDEVWVAAGMYTPTQQFEVGDPRTATFSLVSGVGIYGGFSGNESAREQRAGLFEQTILSGDLAGDDTPGFSDRNDNSYHVVVALGVDASAVLDGFAVRGGYADGLSAGPVPESHDQGSAVNIFYGTATISNCHFIDNWSAGQGAVNDHGGALLSNCVFEGNWSGGAGAGLYIHSAGETTVENCQFLGNATSGLGGGLYVAGNFKSLPEMINGCLFSGNQASGGGGGVYLATASAPVFTNCALVGNQAQNGGGVYDNASNAVLAGCTAEGNSAENGAGIYSRGQASLTLDGCTLRQNEASLAGGGVYFTNTINPQVTNCVVEENSATDGGGLYDETGNPALASCTFQSNVAARGAGIYSHGGSTLSLTGSMLTGNQASNLGGGVYLDLASSPAVVNCTFIGNGALAGGGLYDNASHPQIATCLFEANLAEDGAGVYSHGGSSATLTGCTLMMNQAAAGGGGMWNRESTATLTDCVFLFNTALEGAGVWSLDAGLNASGTTFAANSTTGGQGGAGVYVVLGTATMSDCTFGENSAVGEGFIVGGGLLAYLSVITLQGCTFSSNAADFGGGGIYAEWNEYTLVDRCIFANNAALYGGALYNLNASPQVRNSIFNTNQASGIETSIGGAVYNDLNSNTAITNCTFSGNSATAGGSVVASFLSSPSLTNSILWANGLYPILEGTERRTTVSSCDIQGGWEGPGGGNFEADPLFVFPDGGDLHLSAGSPCINAGDDAAVSPGDLDIDGQQRITGGRVDVGADEVAGSCTADLDGDGAIGETDLALLLGEWGSGPGSASDLNLDGAVDAFDLAQLLGGWGACEA